MAQTHLVEVLKGAGLAEDQIKTLTELPEDHKEFKADDYVAPLHTTIETKVKNDPKFYEGLNKENLPKEFVKTLETEQYGRAANIVRTNMMKAVGLSEKDFAELGEEGKKIDVFTPAFAKKLSEGKVTDKELQQKLIEANQKITELETGAPVIEEKYKVQYEAKVQDFTIMSNVLNQLASVQGLKAPAKYISDKVVQELKSKYAFEIADGVVGIRQKDKPTLKVLTDNGTKELSLSGAINQILEADELIDKKAASTTTTTTLKVETGAEGLKVSKPVSDKIAKRMEEDKKAG